MLSTLRTVTRLPRLIAAAAEATTEAAQQLATLQPAITSRLSAVADDLARIRSTVEPQHQRIAAIQDGLAILPQLATSVDELHSTTTPQLKRITTIEHALSRLEAHTAHLQRTLSQLKGDVEGATEHLPDPDASGPLARARDALTGGS